MASLHYRSFFIRPFQSNSLSFKNPKCVCLCRFILFAAFAFPKLCLKVRSLARFMVFFHFILIE